MKHPYQKVTDGTVCNWEVNPAGTMQDLRDAVDLLFKATDHTINNLPGVQQQFTDFLNRPSVIAMEVKG